MRRRRPSGWGGVGRAAAGLAVRLGVAVLLMWVVGSAVVVLLVGHAQSQARDELLDEAVERVDSVSDAPAGVWLAIQEGGPVQVSRGMPGGLPDRAAMAGAPRSGESVQQEVAAGGVSYTVRTRRSGDRVSQAVFDGSHDRASMQRLLAALAGGGALTAVLAAVLALWFAGRAMRPMAQAMEVQRRFVADAGHELRTPLAVLATRAQLVRRAVSKLDAVPAALAEDASGLVEDARFLGRILEDLLEAADPREPGAPAPVDLCAVADAAVTSFQARAKEAGVALSRVGDPEPVEVVGSQVSLRRAVSALVDNALGFAASRVEVEVVRSGREVVVSVRDDGAGFPAGQADRAFDRFASGRLPAAAGGRHYGLGLALVAETAARHRGSVAASNPPGGGAEVVLRLPAAGARR